MTEFRQTQYCPIGQLWCGECGRTHDIPTVRGFSEVLLTATCPECFKPMQVVSILRWGEGLENADRASRLLTDATPAMALIRAAAVS